MTRFAHFEGNGQNGTVREIFDLPEMEIDNRPAELADFWHDDTVWVACPSQVTQGWQYDGTNWTPPAAPPGPSLHQQIAALDPVLPRHAEDIIAAGGIDVTKLPQVMQQRLAQKQQLRGQIQAGQN
jgi:hypothetical protein